MLQWQKRCIVSLGKSFPASYLSNDHSGMKLNFFWNLERAYIVMADTDNCETHYAGPRSARVCLPEYPNYSFWVWHLGFLTEGMPGETPQELRGWSDLGKGSQHGGVTREVCEQL